jgi:hypothetical protein
MSTIKPAHKAGGASADDCARLWATLTTEYIPSLRVEMRVHQDPSAGAYLLFEVVDDSAQDDGGSPLVNIWATREFHNQLYLISMAQLFDLLISAYRQIDGYFTIGSPYAPTLRRR